MSCLLAEMYLGESAHDVGLFLFFFLALALLQILVQRGKRLAVLSAGVTLIVSSVVALLWLWLPLALVLTA